MTRTSFVKNKEDFICDHCGAENIGNGYTNHCKKCLWSMHVDINPGDRLSHCGGMMPVVAIETKGDKYILTHECEKCGFKRRNFFGDNDNFDELIRLSGVLAEKD